MTYEQENLRTLMELVHNPKNFTINLPNKPYSVSSEDGERGLILFDLRVESQRKVYESLTSDQRRLTEKL